MSLFRSILLVLISVALAIVLARWLGVGRYDIVILLSIIAPLALLATFHKNVDSFYNPQSTVFSKYNQVLRLVSGALGLLFLVGLYKYSGIHGIPIAIGVFLSGLVTQAPLYALLKIGAKTELVLYPVAIAALAAFYLVAI